MTTGKYKGRGEPAGTLRKGSTRPPNAPEQKRKITGKEHRGVKMTGFRAQTGQTVKWGCIKKTKVGLAGSFGVTRCKIQRKTARNPENCHLSSAKEEWALTEKARAESCVHSGPAAQKRGGPQKLGCAGVCKPYRERGVQRTSATC